MMMAYREGKHIARTDQLKNSKGLAAEEANFMESRCANSTVQMSA
jgi:hypothetical protein